MDSGKTYATALSQAIVSENKEFIFRMMCMKEETKEKMILDVEEELIVPFLDVLARMLESKELRFEAIQTLQQVLQLRKDVFLGLGVRVMDGRGKNLRADSFAALKRLLMLMNKERIDLNRLYQLKGRMEYVRDRIEARTNDQENNSPNENN